MSNGAGADIEVIGTECKHECPTCKGDGLRVCDHAGTGRDADGWCTECGQPTDEPGSTTCHCQPE